MLLQLTQGVPDGMWRLTLTLIGSTVATLTSYVAMEVSFRLKTSMREAVSIVVELRSVVSDFKIVLSFVF